MWHDKVFLEKAQILINSRPDTELIYEPRVIRDKPGSVDFKKIIFDRIKFLSDKAMKAKKKRQRWNFTNLMWEFKLKSDEDGVVSKDEFKWMIRQRGIKLEPGLVTYFMSIYPFEVARKSPKAKPKVKVAVKQAAEEYLQSYNILEPTLDKPKKKKNPTTKETFSKDAITSTNDEMKKVLIEKEDENKA